MKVLHVLPYIDPRKGGPVSAVDSLVDLCVQKNIDSSILVINNTFQCCAFENIPLNYEFEKISFLSLFSPRRLIYTFLTIRNILNKYDIIHVHVPFSLSAIISCFICLFLKKCYIISPHGSFSSWAMSKKKLKKKFFMNTIGNVFFKKAIFVHSTSSYEKDQILLNTKLNNIKILHLPVKKYEHNNSILTKKNKSDILKLVTVCRLDPVKNIPLLFEVIYDLNQIGMNISLDVYGAGDETYYRSIANLIHQYKLENCIRLLGFLGRNDLEKELSKYDLFILLSTHENYSMATVEALSVGLPVITSSEVGISSDIIEYNAGLVVPLCDINLLKLAIRKFLQFGLSPQNGLNALKLFNERFSYSAVGSEIKLFYTVRH